MYNAVYGVLTHEVPLAHPAAPRSPSRSRSTQDRIRIGSAQPASDHVRHGCDGCARFPYSWSCFSRPFRASDFLSCHTANAIAALRTMLRPNRARVKRAPGERQCYEFAFRRIKRRMRLAILDSTGLHPMREVDMKSAPGSVNASRTDRRSDRSRP